jgi:hypothetical protein
MSNWSDEETDDPTHADRRNFYKVGEVEQRWHARCRIAVRRHESRQGAAHLRADHPAPVTHSADNPTAHAGVGRVATGRNVALMPKAKLGDVGGKRAKLPEMLMRPQKLPNEGPRTLTRVRVTPRQQGS